MLSKDRFEFLNVERRVETPGDWNASEATRLWLYNLHYFDDLVAEDSECRYPDQCMLIERWIRDNPPVAGAGWEPYPTSLRIVNWIKWSVDGAPEPAGFASSLSEQAEWLSRNIEWHLLGNHLFANAKALIVAGLYFDGDSARNWLRTGTAILEQELGEQILEDGGHFERSPMYHAQILEDVLDLINAAGTWGSIFEEDLAALLRGVAARMLNWLNAMCHPDGQIALFNDSAFGIAPNFRQLANYAQRLGVRNDADMKELVHLDDSGYIRVSAGEDVLIFDVGEIGPRYLPGHAHADTLSFELSLFGQRLIVDKGCSTYDVSAQRLLERGTRAHNTVCVDNEDSSEVWSSFRAARRARPFDVEAVAAADGILCRASHDGYRRLPGRVTHTRTIKVRKAHILIEDELDGEFSEAVAGFLFHPAAEPRLDGNSVRATLAGREIVIEVSGGSSTLVQDTWHPEFGGSDETTRLEIAFTGDSIATEIRW